MLSCSDSCATCPKPCEVLMTKVFPPWLAVVAEPISDSRNAAPKRSMKCRSIVPVSPARPMSSVPSEPMATSVPSGSSSRVQITNTRVCPRTRPDRYSPIRREPLRIKRRPPSSLQTSDVTTARSLPGRSELMAVSSVAANILPSATRSFMRNAMRRGSFGLPGPTAALANACVRSGIAFGRRAAVLALLVRRCRPVRVLQLRRQQRGQRIRREPALPAAPVPHVPELS